MSVSVGSLVLASFYDERKIGPCFWVASSSALIDRCRTTNRGTTMCGKTTMSLKGSSGTVSEFPSLSLSSFLSLRNNIFIFSLCALRRFAINDDRGLVSGHDLLRYHDFLDIGLRWHVVHDVEHDVFHNGPETARPRLPLHRLLRDPPQGFLGEFQMDALHLEELGILLGQRVLRLF